MTLNDLLNRLDYVSQRGNQYIALCPAHSDKTPSLAITEKSGKILVNCWAGCTSIEIVGVLGIKLSDLFIENGMNKQQRKVYAARRNNLQLCEALSIEAHIILQYICDRVGDVEKQRDVNYLKLHPEFSPMPKEPFDRELIAAIRTKKIIGEIYGV